MTTRREFLSISIAGVASIALSAQENKLSVRQPIGLQLYTVRKLAEADLPKTLAEIRAIGYDEVELYWNIYSHSAADVSRMLANAGLKAPSGHFDYDGLDSKLDYAKELGLKYVVCPMLPKQMWSSADGYKQAAEKFNRWGEQVKKLGMTFGFHNHNYEFQKFGDKTGFDILTENTDPDLVKFEMDCYWVTQAGHDPIAMLDKHGNRIRMLHIKDRKPGNAPSQVLDNSAMHFTEFGTGSIRWEPILAKAKSVGIEHYFVEQDEIAGPAMQSIRTSYGNARKLL